MKRIYIQPVIETVQLLAEGMIATSPSIKIGEGNVDAAGALTKKKETGLWDTEENKERGIW